MANPPIQTVHLVFKTHLDIGYTDYARNVVRQYFDHFIPKAMDVAEALRQRGGDEKLIWTTGSWLLYEYLEQADPAGRARVENAIRAGDLAWHALPCTFYSDLLDPSLFAYGLSLAQELDQRFGRTAETATIAAKMTDVPGHTRGIVPLLAAAGVRFLHIGVNSASTPPDAPPVFVWRDEASKSEVIVMYHKGYGDVATLPGLGEALAFAHTNDNMGPPSAEEALAAFASLRQRFPGANVIASTLDAFARQLLTVKDTLPVVRAEIGNSWIHGVGSDPKKVARFRELCRLRREWLATGVEEEALRAFSRPLMLAAEHTWGMDQKIWLDDTLHFDARSFRQARRNPKWKAFEDSWAEQRAYLDQATAALPPALQSEAQTRLAALEARHPSKEGYLRASHPQQSHETPFFTAAFDAHGALVQLRQTATRRDWAAPQNPLGFLHYDTFSAADYERFYRQYIVNKRQTEIWARPDFTKPGLEAADPHHHTWLPALAALYYRREAEATRFLLELESPAQAVSDYGCPKRFTLEYAFLAAAPEIEITLQWFNKAACRLPEALWFGFKPRTQRGAGWTLDKLATLITPQEPLRNSERHLHAVGQGAAYQDHGGAFTLETLDAPLLAPGNPSLLNFTNVLPSAADGAQVNLYNNLWGTNHPIWYEEDGRFRFRLRYVEKDEK